MSIEKKFLKVRAHCKVRFYLSPEEANNSESVYLVGDFNEWNTEAHPMKKAKDGSFSLNLELPCGKDYSFRYLLDSGEWINDPAADAYIPCTFSGEDNSLVKV